MADLHTATLIDDADVADDNELAVRLGGVAGLLKITLAKIKAFVLASGRYPIGWFFTTAPTASEVLLLHVFTKDVTFAANFAGSFGSCGTNPAAQFDIDVQKNGASVGTVSISAAGAVTFTSSGGAAVDFVAGDVMRLVAPAGVDTAASVAATFEGTF